MQLVVGVDVAKGFRLVQAFLRRNEPYRKMENLQHGEEEFERLGELLGQLYEASGVNPVVVLEATAHYHRTLVGYLKRRGWSGIHEDYNLKTLHGNEKQEEVR